MVTVELTLTEQEQMALNAIAQHMGKTQGELVCEAVKQLITQFERENWQRLVQQARGMWQDRTDLPLLADLRREWDRQREPSDGRSSADR